MHIDDFWKPGGSARLLTAQGFSCPGPSHAIRPGLAACIGTAPSA